LTRRPLAVLGLALLVSGCEIENVAIPRRAPLLQVHCILQVGQPIQRIHVERILNGEAASSRGGVVAVTDAVVTLLTPTNRVLTARLVIDSTDPSPGQPGVPIAATARYEVTTAGQNAIQAGTTYRLRVATPDSNIVTGTTQIPNQRIQVSFVNRIVNRDRDTLQVTWITPAFTAANWVRVEGIGTSFNQFVQGDTVRLAGDLQSLEFEELRSHVFVPGHLTPITVAAVDQNVYDYFRSGSDPFTGQGRINHLEGGYGVFGSLGIVARVSADVVAETRDSVVEGRWFLSQSVIGGDTRVADLRLYIDRELRPADDDPVRPLYGSWTPGDGSVSTTRPIATGSREGNEVRLDLLRQGSPFDSMIGLISADTLTATFVSDGRTVRFVRR
jgi:hypothetical protein